MEIRNGKFLDENQQPTEEFSEFLDELQKRSDYAKRKHRSAGGSGCETDR